VSTFLSIVLVILGLVLDNVKTGTAAIFSLIFPPSFYVFALRAIAGYEVRRMPTNVLKGDPDNDLVLLAIIIVAVVRFFPLA
jgi:ATP-binding cassette, subfamily A (ABC1), member 3